jgi:membrane protease YdiL (CAAX protease family)
VCASIGPMLPVEGRRAVITYVVYTAALSSIFYLAIGLSNHGGGEWVDYTGCLMWCPALGAFLTCKHLGRSISTIAWRWGEPKYHIACYLIPLAYGTIMYAIIWTTGIGGFPNKPFVDLVNKDFGYGGLRSTLSIPLYFLFTATIAVIKDFATVLGEEIGWRGFLVPELAKEHRFVPTALISGIIWALWHYPVVLFGDYRPPTPVWFYLTVFTVVVTLANFLWSWMRLKSGSIWPCPASCTPHTTHLFSDSSNRSQSTPAPPGMFQASSASASS